MEQNNALPAIGAPFEGGFFAGLYTLNDQRRALIVAPKATGEKAPSAWIANDQDGPGAVSYHDGLANTRAMAEAGSKLAKWALGLDIAGFADWYLPAQDELEVVYRAFKPTTDGNSLWGRSGINVSAIPPTRPYTTDHPAQTAADLFHAGGAEAFAAAWYWTSTRHAVSSNYAWCQHFGDGLQSYDSTHGKLRARAVRSVAI